MTFDNNSITFVNLTNYGQEPDAYGADFLIRQGEREYRLGVNKLNDLTLSFGDGDICVERISKTATAFAMNTGIRQVSIEYRLVDDPETGLAINTRVGATTDNIPMGQFREIGCGPGIQWWLRTYRGPRDARDKEVKGR